MGILKYLPICWQKHEYINMLEWHPLLPEMEPDFNLFLCNVHKFSIMMVWDWNVACLNWTELAFEFARIIANMMNIQVV